MTWQYKLGSILIRFFFGVFLGFKWRGTENVSEKGGVIIAPNHRSNYDPPLIGSTVKQRAIYYFGKKSVFVNKIFGWFLGRFNVFPADTEKKNDIGSIRFSLKLLKEGKALMVFPEGTRSKTGEFLPAHPGVGYLALKAGVPVNPVIIKGTHESMKEHFLRRKPLYVIFGQPIFPPKIPITSKNAQEFSNKILDKIKEMDKWEF